ncbi:MAG: UDP-N-acetylglucosamine 2-epimerase (non-hydrolyzing) [Vicinamibacterales bacterium]|nr:UDP-N-acetylglucosamine 2-epimerase (non-hydrolyzing) [Vicinamibacterales bacterium]
MTKVLSIVGARPQFIKAAPVHRALAARCQVVQVHTGQHYDDNMSAVFFRELGLPAPDIDLGVGSGSHARQTAAMLERLEPVLTAERPDWVVIYGDTNSTLAAAITAAKLTMPVAHVEAGLRSFNRAMPEEQNRLVADHLSSLLFCPTEAAVSHLKAEGITAGVHLVGDVMEEALADAVVRARQESTAIERLGLGRSRYAVATVHRAENTDSPERLAGILAALNQLRDTVVFPVHPRTRKAIDALDWTPGAHVRMVDPQGYLDMVQLVSGASLVLTDSGGLQKEACWMGVPCVTLRDETEWEETVSRGWNVLAGADTTRIVTAARTIKAPSPWPPARGAGSPSAEIARLLLGETQRSVTA